MLWWFKQAPVNTPLVTQGLNVADPTSGQVGSPNTVNLLGGQSYDTSTRYGGRFTLGGWFDSDGCIGVEASYLFISPKSVTSSTSTTGLPGSPNLFVPFFNVLTGAEATPVLANLAGPFAAPPASGTATLRIANELQAGELNMVGRLFSSNNFNLTGLVGFRYLHFKEDLDFNVGLALLPLPVTFSSRESFDATNNFYGGQLGLRGEYQFGGFFVEASGKVALGSVNQAVDINGASTFAFPGGPPFLNFTNAPGGFFAQRTNIGHHTQNVFGVMPEAEFKLGYNFTRSIQGFVGYNFLYLNDVARPGTMIDRNINPSQVPGISGFPNTLVGPPAPTFSFNRSDFWAQGINFGVQFKF